MKTKTPLTQESLSREMQILIESHPTENYSDALCRQSHALFDRACQQHPEWFEKSRYSDLDSPIRLLLQLTFGRYLYLRAHILAKPLQDGIEMARFVSQCTLNTSIVFDPIFDESQELQESKEAAGAYLLKQAQNRLIKRGQQQREAVTHFFQSLLATPAAHQSKEPPSRVEDGKAKPNKINP